MIFPFIPLILLSISNVVMARIVDSNHFDIQGISFFLLSIVTSLVYGIGLRGKKRRLKLLAFGVVGGSLVVTGVRIVYLQSQIDFIEMNEVSRYSFYGAHASLFLIGSLGAMWRKD